MNRDMRSAGNQLALTVEQSAREVGPFLDVGGDSGPLQNGAHFFDQIIEAVTVQFVHNFGRALDFGGGASLVVGEFEGTVEGEVSGPATLQEKGAEWILNHDLASDGLALREMVPVDEVVSLD